MSDAILGRDGYPVPQSKDRKVFKATCPVCIDGNANIRVSKSGNWIVKCGNCSVILYLNSITSINLFRGLQSLLDAYPEYQVSHVANIVRHAPDYGE
jgi:hypothetical protein